MTKEIRHKKNLSRFFDVQSGPNWRKCVRKRPEDWERVYACDDVVNAWDLHDFSTFIARIFPFVDCNPQNVGQ